jgi:hypothetical protein
MMSDARAHSPSSRVTIAAAIVIARRDVICFMSKDGVCPASGFRPRLSQQWSAIGSIQWATTAGTIHACDSAAT